MPAALLAPQRAFSVASHGGGHARPARAAGLAVSDLLLIGRLLGELELLAADLFEGVAGGVAVAAAVGGHPGAELQCPELLVGQ